MSSIIARLVTALRGIAPHIAVFAIDEIDVVVACEFLQLPAGACLGVFERFEAPLGDEAILKGRGTDRDGWRLRRGAGGAHQRGRGEALLRVEWANGNGLMDE